MLPPLGPAFTGTGVFGKVNDTWTANVNLTRQVAKLRIKAGIHPDAVPSTLEIDPRSISVTVEKMASASPTTDDGNNPDHKDYDPGDTFAGMEQTIVRSTTSGTPLRMEENWASGMKIDSLYMHPHDASTAVILMNYIEKSGIRYELPEQETVIADASITASPRGLER